MRLRVIMIFVFLPLMGWCQQPISKHYDVSHGLTHSTVFRIHQQNNGLLWIGTDNGLCSFDGKEFQHVELPWSGEPRSILGLMDYGDDTLLVYVYRRGFYWVHDFQLTPYLPESDEFMNVVDLKLGPNGRIWMINSGGGLGYIQDRQSKPFPNFKKDMRVTCLELVDQRVWVGTNRGLYQIDVHTLELSPHPLFLNQKITGLTRTAKGDLWVGTSGKAFLLSTVETLPVLIDSMPQSNVNCVIEDPSGGYWLEQESNGILWIPNPQLQDSVIQLLCADLNDLTLDDEGNVWAATYGDGIYGFTSGRRYLTYDLIQPRAIYQSSSGDLYVGALGQVVKIQESNLLPVPMSGMNQTAMVERMFETQDELVVCTALEVYEIKGNEAILVDSVLGKTVLYHLLDTLNHPPRSTGGKLWSGKYSSMFLTLHGKLHGVVAEQKDKEGNLWLATEIGLKKMASDSVFIEMTCSQYGLCKAYDLVMDSNGTVWCGTSFGLLVCDDDSCKTVALNPEQRNQPTCRALDLDTDGRLWIGSSEGVFCYEGGSYHKISFPSHDRMTEVYDLKVDRQNCLWVATPDQLTRLDLTQTDTHTNLPRPVFGAIEFGNQKLAVQEVPMSIPFESGNNNLQIQFSAVSLTHGNEVVTEYCLKGQDTRWNTTNQRKITYHALDPGDYKFYLRTRFKNGFERSKTLSFSFTLLPPFYQTWWFKTLSGLFLALIMAGVASLIYRKRMEKIEKQKAVTLRINDLRQSALNAMMNPHFINNTLHSIQHFVQTRDKVESGLYISRFAQLIRKSLEVAFQNEVTLYGELERLTLFLELEKIRLQEKFNYQINYPSDLDTEAIMLPNLVIQPFVENAIWHGILPLKTAGFVRIAIETLSENHLQIVVEDNGIGYSKSSKPKDHRSLGIELVQEKLALTHAENRVEIHPGTERGTKVVLTLHIG